MTTEILFSELSYDEVRALESQISDDQDPLQVMLQEEAMWEQEARLALIASKPLSHWLAQKAVQPKRNLLRPS